ncbi:MAG: TadE/TadG family type IV pilus assembly protein [Lacipirellulaceae bacterium]
MKQRTLRRRNDRRGATAVEFALVAPAFFLVLFALFEFSRMNVLRHTADNAAYEAARVAMVPGATAAEAIAEANRLLSVVATRGARVTVNPAVLANDTNQVTVTVAIPLDQNGWVVPRFTRSQTLQARSTLRTERVRTR